MKNQVELIEEETIGTCIKHARKAKGWTQEHMASILFTSKQTISHWEKDQCEPDFEMLRRLIKLLNIDVVKLFAGILCFMLLEGIV